MLNLLKMNGVAFPDPEGGFELSYNDVTNDYDAEDGTKTIELVRSGVRSVKVSYKGLTRSKLELLKPALETVSDVEVYDAPSGEMRAFQAKVSGVAISKSFHHGDTSVWSLSFDIEEL